jgi:hypothetical protein
MSATPCQVTDALARMQYDIIVRVNRKFDAERRLAVLLMDLGSLEELVPNINALIPVLSIDFGTYNQLAAACPFLGLPFPGEKSLIELRSAVIGAYANLAKSLLNHPWSRLGKLQGEFDKFANKINFGLGTARSYIQCLQAACNAVGALGSAFVNVTQANISSELAKFAAGYTANAGQVLTAPMKLKVAEAIDTKNELINLGGDFKSDYNTAKAALAASSTPAPAAANPPAPTIFPNAPFVP